MPPKVPAVLADSFRTSAGEACRQNPTETHLRLLPDVQICSNMFKCVQTCSNPEGGLTWENLMTLAFYFPFFPERTDRLSGGLNPSSSGVKMCQVGTEPGFESWPRHQLRIIHIFHILLGGDVDMSLIFILGCHGAIWHFDATPFRIQLQSLKHSCFRIHTVVGPGLTMFDGGGPAQSALFLISIMMDFSLEGHHVAVSLVTGNWASNQPLYGLAVVQPSECCRV